MKCLGFMVLSVSLLMGSLISACTTSSDTSSSRLSDLQPWDRDDPDQEQVAEQEIEDPMEQDPLVEVCDGRDNNGDGKIDEGTGGGQCVAPGGEPGSRTCLAGKLRCMVCDPGSSQEVPCGCDIKRVDVCGQDGVWRRGACDPCDDPLPVPCGFCGTMDASGVCIDAGECEPGDIMFRRCDSCPDNSGCGQATCVGEKWQCAYDCQWRLLEGCQIRPEECDRDAKLIVPCGQCGLLSLECDGCFWNRTSCQELGACFPGENREVPCFGKRCEEGFSTTMACTEECEWEVSTDCVGCAPGTYVEDVDCLSGYPLCGQRQYQWECVITREASDCQPAIGEEINHTYLGNCPDRECYPGQKRTEYCMLDSGEGGESSQTCNSRCTWSAWTPCRHGNNSCPPGEQTSEETPCGCGVSYTTIKTCRANGIGWDTQVIGREQCPECEPGDSYSQSCTTGGRCGTRTVRCSQDCEWNHTAECVQRPGSCVNGSTESRACSHQCGTGHATYMCVNCNWQMTGECQPDSAGECTPGDSRTVNCNPPGCPQRQDTCSQSCRWVEGACPACG